MAREDWDELSVNQARAEADTLAARIRALNDILSATKDPAQQSTLKAQLVDLDAQWTAAITQRDRLNEGVPQPPKANGDMDALRAQVAALGKALASDKPDEAHAIILKSIDALTKMDDRLVCVEARVAAIERHINPPWQVTFWRVIAAIVALFAGSLFWIKETREVLFGVVLWAGLATEGALLLLVVACLLLANAKLEHAK